MVVNWIDPTILRWIIVAIWLSAAAVGLVVCGGNFTKARSRRKEFFRNGPEFKRRGIIHRHRIQRRLFIAMTAAATVGVMAAVLPRPTPPPPVTVFALFGNTLLLAFILLIASLSTEVRRYELEQFAADETLLETISAEFSTDLESSMRSLLDRLESALKRIEAGDVIVAKDLAVANKAVAGIAGNLVVAQKAVDQLKEEDDASRARADAVDPESSPGSAADAASQSGE